MRLKIAIMLVVVLALIGSVAASPAPFVSPVPWCDDDAIQPCLPWRPTPPPKEPKEIEPPTINLELAQRGACIAAARTWGVDEARCK